jgi:rRNA maturation protein Nop10
MRWALRQCRQQDYTHPYTLSDKEFVAGKEDIFNISFSKTENGLL